MTSQINVSALTLNAEEVKDVSQVIFERVFENSTIEQIHDIVTGVKYKTQIVFGGSIGDSLKVSTGCTPNAANGLTFTEDFWDPTRFDARWEHCQADMNALFKMFRSYQKINPDFYNRIGSEEMGVLIAKIEDALPTDIMTKVWFSDKAAETIADGGKFKNGTDLDLYNGIDGIWKQVFAKIPTTAANYVAIAKNAGASYAAQAITPAESAQLLTDMYFKADARLTDDPNAKFLVTSSIYNAYLQYLASTQAAGGGFTQIIENGQPKLYVYGIEVVKMSLWDRKIKQLFDNGTKLDMPNRALLTTKGNIPVGTVSTEDFDHLDSFYDQYRKVNVLDAAVALDGKFLQPYLGVAAF